MSMLRVVSLPFCQVVMLDEWNAPASRYFTAYIARGSSRWLMGHPVVDEFATLSSPIFLTPRALLGKIYNAGISLGHMRDSEMALDLGWPPLCIGVDQPAPQLPATWQVELIEAITAPAAADRVEPDEGELAAVRMPTHEIETFRLLDATVMVVSEPLLPRQLSRLCEAVKTPVGVAVAVGNRVERSAKASPQEIRAVSERRLAEILESAGSLQ